MAADGDASPSGPNRASIFSRSGNEVAINFAFDVVSKIGEVRVVQIVQDKPECRRDVLPGARLKLGPRGVNRASSSAAIRCFARRMAATHIGEAPIPLPAPPRHYNCRCKSI